VWREPLPIWFEREWIRHEIADTCAPLNAARPSYSRRRPSGAQSNSALPICRRCDPYRDPCQAQPDHLDTSIRVQCKGTQVGSGDSDLFVDPTRCRHGKRGAFRWSMLACLSIGEVTDTGLCMSTRENTMWTPCTRKDILGKASSWAWGMGCSSTTSQMVLARTELDHMHSGAPLVHH